MEPIKPSTRKAILERNPQAQPDEIDEYERLLAERFARDPDLPGAPIDELQKRTDRLKELHDKLFGDGK